MKQSDREVSQLKVNVSASPAWELELDGGVNAVLPSARALKCCEERGEGIWRIWGYASYDILKELTSSQGFPGDSSGKEPACHCRIWKRHGFDPWVRKIPWKRAWQPI